MNVKSIVLIYLFLPFSSVVAFPDGCPVCTVGAAAPQSLHLDRPQTVTGAIPNGQFQVKIGSLVLDSSVINQISPGIDLSVQLLATEIQFRGVLIVINKEGVDLSSNLRPTSSNVQRQAACPDTGYSGITHRSADEKSSVEGTLFLGPGAIAFLDVNIVVSNSFELGSTYYYTRYQISTVVQSPAAPVPVPVSVPHLLPVNIPIAAPVPFVDSVPVPVPSPIAAPWTTNLPVPVTTPVKVPIPLSSPTSTTMAPTKTPIQDRQCGVFGLGIVCFGSDECGWIRRLLNIGHC